MKSREYINIFNGLTYWLENGSIMMRKPGSDVVKESLMTAEEFFVMVGNNSLVLIEE